MSEIDCPSVSVACRTCLGVGEAACADDKSAAETKISSAIMMQDSELIDQLTECADISVREIEEDEADMNYIYEE